MENVDPFPVVDDLICDTTYFELSRNHEFHGLGLALCIMLVALFKVVRLTVTGSSSEAC